MKPGVKNPQLSMEDSMRDRAQAKANAPKKLSPATKIARREGHGLNRSQLKDMGLHTSQHFVGPQAAVSPIQRLGGKRDGLGDYADGVAPKIIGG
jgi:hypothetical protein